MEIPKATCLKITIEDKILLISINNPPHNYLASRFFIELHSCRELMLSPEIGAVIFTGEGRSFSKGADTEELKNASHLFGLEEVNYGNEIYNFISRLNKPVIAAIQGPCFGGGLELALACHLRLCSEKALLGLPEVSIGVLPGLGGVQRLIRIVGEAKALEMILLGDIIPASRALELNLVSRVYPKKDFMNSVSLFVKTILSAPGAALEEVLKLICLSRPENEEKNISLAAEGFVRLVKRRG